MLFPYRKKALSCHPDKNPNDEQAGDTFHQLTEALTILTNPKSRKSYDNLLKSRKLANSGRQKIKIVRTAPEREYNKNETTDEDEENELYDHPDFENVKVSGQRIKPKRYISIGKYRFTKFLCKKKIILVFQRGQENLIMSNLKNLWNEMVNQFHGPFSILVYKFYTMYEIKIHLISQMLCPGLIFKHPVPL